MRDIARLPTAAQLLYPDPPPMLYHYTSAAALISIIDSRQLWAGLPVQMNDAEEQIRAFHWLEWIAREHNSPDATPVSEMFAKVVAEQIYAGHAHEGSAPYLVSFSADGDSLSQWRAYGPRGGVCLGVPFEMIRTAADRQGWYLAKCIYDEDDMHALVSELFEHHLGLLDTGLAATGPVQAETVAEMVAERAQMLFSELRLYGLFIKNPSFHAEMEWRLLKFDAEPDDGELRFVPGTDGVRAFLPFRLLADDHPGFPDHPRPSVHIGPSPLPGIAEYATKRLLERWTGPGNADVWPTRSSFR
ncbi:DUF2971 domain-containing protein [Nocardia sp. NPDC058058]|uniref:DUF2971 domain-containing protein n=1 Tax=Nocardia sp. NPDC058058 TaxID=3346317 RepID=UPI0036D9F095